jgi:hypothetical protein
MAEFCYWTGNGYEPSNPTIPQEGGGGNGWVCVEIPDVIELPPEEPGEGEDDPDGQIVLPDGTVLDATGLTAPLIGAKQIAWQARPWRTLWVCRTDGQLVGLTYDKDHDVWGWHRHPKTNGACMSIAVIPSAFGGHDELWAVWRRMVGETQKHFIERMTPRIKPASSSDKARYCHLDCSLSYGVDAAGKATGAPAITTVTGLDHFFGEEVRVWADGVDMTFEVVDVTGGKGFVLPGEFSIIHAGIHTDSTLVSLPTRELWTDKQSIPEIDLLFLNTWGGKAGRSPLAAELEQLEYRTPQHQMDATPPMATGFVNVKLGGKHDYAGIWVVVQDTPGPMTVLAAVPKYVASKE